MQRRIVISLYAHTSDEEIAEILETLRNVGIYDAYVEGRNDPNPLATQTPV